MEDYVSVNGNNIDKYISENIVLLLSLRKSRIKVKRLAILEAYFALSPVNVTFIKNGPLGDLKGTFSFFIPKDKLNDIIEILPGIGYCNKFYILDFKTGRAANNSDIKTKSKLCWKGRAFSINRLFFQDNKVYKKHSSNKRKFLIFDQNHKVKEIYGYRGNGTELGRRALPVEDARCLVNLSIPDNTTRTLDPFAGAGGIVYETKYINKDIDVFSIDIDPILAPGLEYYGSRHYVGDSEEITFSKNYFDSIVTEVPFSLKANNNIIRAISNLYNSLKKSGRLVLMTGIEQSRKIETAIRKLGFYRYAYYKVDRKGTEVVVMAWFKSFAEFQKINNLLDVIKFVY